MERVNDLIVFEKGKILSPYNVFEKIKEMNIDYEQENLIVLYFNTRKKLIDYEIVFKGGAESSLICPKILFRKALLRNAMAIIVAHNHPSGDLTPSDEDIEVYGKLKAIGNIITIPILDFIIFNNTQFYSCLSRGEKDK